MRNFALDDFVVSRQIFDVEAYVNSALRVSSGLLSRSLKVNLAQCKALWRFKEGYEKTLTTFLDYDQGGARLDLLENGYAVSQLMTGMDSFVQHACGLQYCLQKVSPAICDSDFIRIYI